MEFQARESCWSNWVGSEATVAQPARRQITTRPRRLSECPALAVNYLRAVSSRPGVVCINSRALKTLAKIYAHNVHPSVN